MTTTAVTWERLPWVPRASAHPLNRAERTTAGRDYAAAIPAALASLRPDVRPDVLAAADDARAEISRFDAELSTMLPGSEIAPLAAVLLRTESASSSQIENITARAKALAIAELGVAKYGSNASLVASNVDAMTRACALAESTTPATILAIHEALMRGQDHADPGLFRTEQVWIGGSSASPHSAAFVPPHHSRVPAAIDDLCTYIARTDVPLVAQVAIAHAQFETIHPFNDGNGRTGRALVHAMLKHGGATTRATVPVSAGLLADTGSYFAALTAYRAGDASPIVERLADASFAAIGNGRQLAGELTAVHQRWSESITIRRRSAIWQVLPLLLSHPAVTSAIVQQATGLTQPAADRVINQLREAGILTKAAGIQRYVVWVATDVTDALDAFAERARRGRIG
ncbi:Fic family protein [Nocardioides sp. WS12]|uniref:Fic family protein n=1 Tax=Nocardioides sp. WS12 TaxID=2486272 RepID=UPI0015FDBFDC|nr:Fic family protein [Nocardioides sp. WS12]